MHPSLFDTGGKLNAMHPNRSKKADPVTWCQWLAMDHGALDLDMDDRALMLRECHLPGSMFNEH